MDSEADSAADAEAFQLLDLPPELVLGTIQLLSRDDQQSFSLSSQSCRQLAVPFLFARVVCSRGVADKLQSIDQANEHIKAAIRELTVDESRNSSGTFAEEMIFRLLKSLPNLRAFRWHRLLAGPSSLNDLVASLQHCPLEHLEYWRPHTPREPDVIGLSGLKTVALKLSPHSSLYELILPSFSTLVELRIRFPETSASRTFDLLPLRPLGATLQKFFYKAHIFDPGLLDMIPVVFPLLTTLELMFWETPQDPWKKSYDLVLSRNTKLEYLALYAGGSPFCDSIVPLQTADCPECADQRSKATHALAAACPGLKRCTWDNRHARYMFNVRPPRHSADGNDNDDNSNASLKWERASFVRPRTYRQSWFCRVELEHGFARSY